MAQKSTRSFCSVPGCSCSAQRQPYLSFHSFPKDGELRRKWVHLIRRQEGPRFVIRRGSTHVCSRHFTSQDYALGTAVRRLKPGTVPSLFPWNGFTSVKKRPSVYERCQNRRSVLFLKAVKLDHNYATPARAACPAGVHPPLAVKDGIPTEQQKWITTLDQNQVDPKPPHFKEEQEELLIKQEADVAGFPPTPVPVKSEDDEEEAQSSQLHQTQTVKKEEPDTEDEPASTFHPHSQTQTDGSSDYDTDDSDFWKETTQQQRNEVSTDHRTSAFIKKPPNVSKSDQRMLIVQKNTNLLENNSKEKLFRYTCSEQCSKRQPLKVHTGVELKTRERNSESPKVKEEPQDGPEADLTKFPFTPVPVKSEDDEAQPSQLHQRHTENHRRETDGEHSEGQSTTQTSETYMTQVHGEHQEVKWTSCDRPTAQSKCHHMDALLVWVGKNITRKDVECLWKRPRAVKEETIASKPVSQRTPSTTKAGIKRPFEAEDRAWAYDYLQKLGRFTGMRWLLSPDPQQYLPNKTFDAVVASTAFKASENKAAFLVSGLAVTAAERSKITSDTVGQRTNHLWVAYTKNRITATHFGLVLTAIKRCFWPCSLFKTLLGQHDVKDGVKSFDWGAIHRPRVRQMYTELTGLAVQETGVVLSPSGLLGGSPDGVVSPDHIIQIKCPWSVRNMTLLQAAERSLFFLELDKVTGALKLKQSHNFWDQIQGNMHLTGASRCDLVVWTTQDFIVLPQLKDPSWAANINKLEVFYVNKFMPQFLL